MSLSVYQRLFFTNFELEFGAPRLDTCRTCDMMYVKMIAAGTEEDKMALETKSSLGNKKIE